MSLPRPVLDLVEALYAAATDEIRWPEALRLLAECCGAQAATFWVLDGTATPRLPVFHYVNLDPQFIREYLDNTAAIDPTVQYLLRHPDEAIVHDGLVICDRDKDRHPYYAWQDTHCDLRFRLLGRVSPATGVQAGVSLLRDRRTGRFEPQDVETFAVLHRHVQRALELGFKLGTLATMQQLTAELLDRNPAAVVLLDDQRRVVYCNRSADRIGAARDGVAFSSAGLAATKRREDARLQTLIGNALAGAAGDLRVQGGTMRIERPSGKRAYAVLVAPLARRGHVLSSLKPAVCVVISDPDGDAPLASERLQVAFGLTESEARLAALLGSGNELKAAADKLQITYGTARARLAEIFEKTQTRRQAELVKLLLASIVVGSANTSDF